MSNAPVLPLTPASVLGFTISDTVGVAVLLIVAGVGLFVAASSRWRRRTNDRHLGVAA